MNAEIEMHDSSLLAISSDELGRGLVLLKAYVYRSEGQIWTSSRESGWQRVRIIIDAMTVNGEVGALPTCIYEGSLIMGTAAPENMIPLPTESSEAVRLELTLEGDARTLLISGTGISVKPEGDFKLETCWPGIPPLIP